MRRPAMAALTTAVAARTRAHNDAAVGRTTDEAILYADWLVRSIACQHVAVTPGGWGGGWQTAHWATLAGEAAWLIWDRSDAADPRVRRADDRLRGQQAAHPADRLLGGCQPARSSARATPRPRRTPGTPRCWSSRCRMMPTHSQAKNWRRKAVDLELAAYASLSDAQSGAVINGVTLADRLDGVQHLRRRDSGEPPDPAPRLHDQHPAELVGRGLRRAGRPQGSGCRRRQRRPGLRGLQHR